jgi:hypothetical protein
LLRFTSVAAAIALVVFAFEQDATAHCRTTTTKSPPDYDATQLGCFASGVPLFWRNACVGYSLGRSASKKISYEDAANGMSQAFTRWTGASCSNTGTDTNTTGRSRPSIDVRDLGPADCEKVEYVSGAANQNVVLFRDDSWKYPPTVLGLTTVVYAPDNGEIYNADMEINTYDMDPLAVHDPVGPNDYDFLSVVTHEAGHFLGMAHSDVQTATMYARYDPGQTSMRNLAPDDIEGICEVYRPNGDRAVLNDRVAVAPQCDPTPRGGYSPECQDAKTGCLSSVGGSVSSPLSAIVSSMVALCGLVVLRRRRSPSR